MASWVTSVAITLLRVPGIMSVDELENVVIPLSESPTASAVAGEVIIFTWEVNSCPNVEIVYSCQIALDSLSP